MFAAQFSEISCYFVDRLSYFRTTIHESKLINTKCFLPSEEVSRLAWALVPSPSGQVRILNDDGKLVVLIGLLSAELTALTGAAIPAARRRDALLLPVLSISH